MIRLAPVAPLLLLLLAACAVGYAPREPAARAAAPLPLEVAARFDYAERGTPAAFDVAPKDACSRWDAFTVTGSVTLRGDPDPQKVHVEYYRSKSAPAGRAPALVVTPILGGGDDVARLVARHFADEGLHVAIVWRGVKVLAGQWPEAEIEHQLRRGVVARRRTIDWLESREEVDPARIAAFGISMGGILTTILAAVEPRLHSAVIALASGELGAVVAASDEPRLVEYREARAAAGGVTPREVEERIAASLVSDPVRLAPYVDPRRVLLFITARDTTVPTTLQRRLRTALGDPAAYELPVGHYGTVLYTSFIKARSAAWLHARLERPNPRAVAPGSRGAEAPPAFPPAVARARG